MIHPFVDTRFRSDGRGWLSHSFGMVRLNADGSPRAHQGWDLVTSGRPAVRAVVGGRVVLVDRVGDYGAVVAVANASAVVWYAHCVGSVRVGAELREGDELGQLEPSGGPLHLHLELRPLVSGLDPLALPRGLVGRVSPLRLFGRVFPPSE